MLWVHDKAARGVGAYLHINADMKKKYESPHNETTQHAYRCNQRQRDRFIAPLNTKAGVRIKYL